MSTEKKSVHEDMRVLRTAVCQSLSGRSSLTYDVGVKNGKDVYFRLVANSGSGIFNKDWVAWAEIETLLLVEGHPITSGRLKGLAVGKSANTPGFLAAVLVSEGLLAVSKDNLRNLDRLDPAGFQDGIKEMIETEVSQPPEVAAKETKVKTAKAK